MAFVIHLLLTVYFGVLALAAFLLGNIGSGIVVTIGFAAMAGTLVTFTLLATQDNWRPDDTPYDGRGQVVGPRAAWANTRPWGRIGWVLFGVAFLSGSVLLGARHLVGVIPIVAALMLAIIAMRSD